jgi:hypothetical protein
MERRKRFELVDEPCVDIDINQTIAGVWMRLE